MIGESILNSNIIYFYFSFLNAINVKSLFQLTAAAKSVQHLFQIKMTELCAEYENYLTALIGKLNQPTKQSGETVPLRQDISYLKDCLHHYDIN